MCHLVSGSQLMNGEDLRWVKCLAEYIHSPKLTTEHPIGIRRLRRTKETFIITLEQRRGEEWRKRKRWEMKWIEFVDQGIDSAYQSASCGAF